MMYHPSHHVPDLGVAERFFARVFGRPSTPLSALTRSRAAPGATAPADYSTFTPIAEVLFDSIDPRHYVVGGVQRYPTVDRPRLKGLGWYVHDMATLYASLREHGIELVDQLDRPADGDEPPTAAGAPMPLFFTTPAGAGLRHEFVPRFPFPLDPRLDRGWELPPVSDEDPLGIVRCAQHTVLTTHPERARRLVVDVLGGSVVDTGRDEVLGAATTTVHLAGSMLQLAVPDAGTAAHAELVAASSGTASPDDLYHSLTWQVADLDRTERHLWAEGVAIATRTGSVLAVDPATALGIPWRFTTTPVPGDPRR